MSRKAIILDAKDNVASALTALDAGERIVVEVPSGGQRDVTLTQSIPLGHKFALEEIAMDSDVIKYGVPIGRATTDISCGQHVHAHNLV